MITPEMPEHLCHYCRQPENDAREMRPYGPGGSWVCFPCATGTPEREKAASGAFGALLDANESISPTGVTVIGESSGPRPLDPKDLL